MEIKVSPDEKITMNALDSADPFARPGKKPQALNQHIPKGPQRDFSHYDEPVEKKSPEIETIEEKIEVKQTKRGRKPKRQD